MASPYQPTDSTEERPLGELFSELTQKLQVLLRKEVELAKVEVQEQVSRAGKAGALFAGTAVVGFIALVLLSFALAWGLAEVMAPGWAFLVVGVVYVLIAGLLFLQARKRAAGLRPVPQQTMRTLKDDVDTAKTSISRGMSTSPDTPWRS